MERIAALIDALVYTRSRNGKLALIADYLRNTPDPDRGWALAALTGGLAFPAVKAGTVRALIGERVDPVLFALSREYVGDTAETVSLLWPAALVPPGPPPTISEAVDALAAMTRATVARELADLLDRLDAKGRFALLKPATGALRIGVSARLARTAMAQAFALDLDAIEELWHADQPPYAALFAWAEGRTAKPDVLAIPVFRPFMLAHPLEDGGVDLADYAAEWKWDGIRIQLVHAGGAASFNALQQRLGRKQVPARMLAEYPPSCAFTMCCSMARKTCAPSPGPSAASGWKPSSSACQATGSTSRP